MSNPFIGEIKMFGGNFAPLGWAFCDGSLLSISENDTLFTLIGTTYGGDGQTTFALPDLRGRAPLHLGTGGGDSYQIGQAAGVESVTLTTQQIPAHTHSMNAIGGQPGNLSDPSGTLPAMSLNVVPFTNRVSTENFAAAAIAATGGSQPHDNMQPFLSINFIIALYGIFPSQG